MISKCVKKKRVLRNCMKWYNGINAFSIYIGNAFNKIFHACHRNLGEKSTKSSISTGA